MGWFNKSSKKKNKKFIYLVEEKNINDVDNLLKNAK